MRKTLLLLLLFFSILGLLPAQSTATMTGPWYMGKPIEAIKFEGLNHIDLSDLEGITSQFIGIPYSPGVYKDLQSKLFALDFLKNSAQKQNRQILIKMLLLLFLPLKNVLWWMNWSFQGIRRSGRVIFLMQSFLSAMIFSVQQR